MTDTKPAADGDLIEAAKGEALIRGRVERVGGALAITSARSGVSLEYLEHEGFTITVVERAEDGLPTTPGMYLDRDGDRWNVTDAGELIFRNGMSVIRNPARYAPFRRVEYAAEAERRILDRLAEALYVRSEDAAATAVRQVGFELFGIGDGQ